MGIEPTFSAWEADVLPLNYTRLFLLFLIRRARRTMKQLTGPEDSIEFLVSVKLPGLAFPGDYIIFFWFKLL